MDLIELKLIVAEFDKAGIGAEQIMIKGRDAREFSCLIFAKDWDAFYAHFPDARVLPHLMGMKHRTDVLRVIGFIPEDY